MPKRGRTNDNDHDDDDHELAEKFLKLEENDADATEELTQSLNDFVNECDSLDDDIGSYESEADSDQLLTEVRAILADTHSIEGVWDATFTGSDEVVSNVSNASSWSTISEITVSESEQHDQQPDADGEDDSPLRVSEENEGIESPTSKSEAEPEPDEEPKRISKRPKPSDLKINPKNYDAARQRRNPTERSTPPPQMESDEESDNEGKPKRQHSQKWEEEVRERRPVKKTPPKGK